MCVQVGPCDSPRDRAAQRDRISRKLDPAEVAQRRCARRTRRTAGQAPRAAARPPRARSSSSSGPARQDEADGGSEIVTVERGNRVAHQPSPPAALGRSSAAGRRQEDRDPQCRSAPCHRLPPARVDCPPRGRAAASNRRPASLSFRRVGGCCGQGCLCQLVVRLNTTGSPSHGGQSRIHSRHCTRKAALCALAHAPRSQASSVACSASSARNTRAASRRPPGRRTDRPVLGVLALLEVPDAHVIERTPRREHHATDHQPGRGHQDRVGDTRRAHPPVAVQPRATQLITGYRPVEDRCEHLAIHQRSEEEVGHDAR